MTKSAAHTFGLLSTALPALLDCTALSTLLGCAFHPSRSTAIPPPAVAPGRPVTWFSVPATDLDAAARFYERAFDWRVEPTTREEDPNFDYRVMVNSESDETYTAVERGRVNGCLVRRATGIAAPTVLIEVDDLAAAARRILDAGGRIVSPEIPMRTLQGRFFLAEDPEGNVLEVFRGHSP